MFNIFYCLLWSTFFLSGVCLWFSIKTYAFYKKHSSSIKNKTHFTIAILAPSPTSFVVNFIRPFTAYIKKYASFEFETIECFHQLDRDLAQEWANFIAEHNVDLVFAIGTISTDIMYNMMKTRQHKIPVISGGAPGTSEPSFETMQATIPFTAVTTHMDWPDKICFLKKIVPHIKTVLIIVRSMDEISRINLQEKNTLTTTLRKLHVAWKMHHAPNIDKTTDLTAELLEGVDLIILSRSSEVLRHTARIAQEAQPFNVPVLSPDTASPEIFIGMSECPERTIGIQCAKYAIEILEDNINPSALPLKEVREKKKVVIYPHNSSPMMAATAIGNLLNETNQINLVLTSGNKSTI